ncbi:MAG: hypothetical protein A2075_18895 [Geobacteraceae bacterium GWC2_58_44]|nr:MAG: hypothetical protein A2075_18895 [Geobacteraceae bacterium GWC2_58_44]HBG07876.1 hypothetical protein [Geobacter sp.]
MNSAHLTNRMNPNAKRFCNALLALFILLGTCTSCLASSVTLQWEPETAADLAGYKVYYSVNSPEVPFAGTGASEGASPISITNVSSATITGLDPEQAHYFAVTAYNTSGVESPYSNILQIPELVPPAVEITSPVTASQASGTVSINAIASDNVEVSGVRFLVNGVLATTVSDAPYLFSWDTSMLPAGSYTISAEAFDTADNVGKSNQVTLLVLKDGQDPVASLDSPSNGATLSGTVQVTASASDDVAVTKVEIYLDETLLFAGNGNPVAFNWHTEAAANGSHTLSVKAYDEAGHIGHSSKVAVNVMNDTVAPVLSIASSVKTGPTGQSLTISASASDNVAVTKVEFYLNGAVAATSTSTPYDFYPNSATMANGAYTVTAKAYDAAGNAGQSNDLTFNVSNDSSAPTVNSFSMPATTNSTSVAVSSFGCSDDVAVTGYLITESAGTPAASAAGWSATAPISFTFAGTGSRTAYAWAKDAAGHVSAGRAVPVLIDTVLPVISSMSLASGSSNVTLKVAATDNIAVIKMELYVDASLQLETSAASFTYVWAVAYKKSQSITVKVYDAAGNVRSQTFRVSKI